MTKTSLVSRSVTATLAIVFLIPALVLFIMWSSIGLQVSGISDHEKMGIYMDYFPAWLHNITEIHIISLVCCLIAIILATRSFSKHLLSIRVLMLVTTVVAVFIILFDVFQMIQI